MFRPARRSLARARAAAAAALAALTLGMAGCAAPPAGELTVFAAASLDGAFSRLGQQFEQAHPGTRVRLQLAGSSDLVAQLENGAPADVVALAATEPMQRLADAGLLDGSSRVFASNAIEIAVPPGNPSGVTALADLDDPGLAVVTCAPQVPCGALAAEVAAAAGVALRPVSEELSVTGVLARVRSGEADAGLVYRTDVLAAGGSVGGVPIPGARGMVTDYPIAVVAGGASPALAAEFVALVTGAPGRQVLREAGFTLP